MRSTSRSAPLVAAALAIATLAGCDQSTDPTSSRPMSANPALGVATTGSGAPSGAHYNLNIIGVSKDKSPNFDGGSGRRIFVDLGKTGTAANTRINLLEGDFAVVDADGTDGTAEFHLPNPDPDGDGTTAYSVYVRALGKPDRQATLQSCYEDVDGTWCAANFAGGVEPITLAHSKSGAPKFSNVSKDLLFVDYCTAWTAGPDAVLGTGDDLCTTVTQSPLFGNTLLSYYWSYDNQGLKLAQLRFYEVPTTVSF
jgi:hypothetical protein